MSIPPKDIERICGEVAALKRLVQSLRQRTEEVSDHLSGSGAQRDLANFTRDSALFLYNAEQFLATRRPHR